jgi:hypothetical protein
VQTYELKEAKLAIDWSSVAALACLGALQVAIGCACMMAGHVHLAATLIIEGCKDIYQAKLVANGMAFNWDAYVTQKAITAAITIGTMGAEHFLSKVGLMTASAGPVTENMISATLKIIGQRLVVGAAIDHLVDRSVAICLNELKDKIRHSINKEITSCINNRVGNEYVQLFSADEYRGENNAYNNIRVGTLKALEEHSNVVGNIASQIAKGVSHNQSASNIVQVLGGALQIGEIISEISKVGSLSDKISDRLADEINTGYQNITLESLLKNSQSLSRLSNQTLSQYDTHIHDIEQRLRGKYVSDKCMINQALVLPGGQHQGQAPHITAFINRPALYRDDDIALGLPYSRQLVASLKILRFYVGKG